MLLRFDEFMRRALYDAEHGYYRRERDPFGIAGDFVTASQVQPLFGNIIAAQAELLEPGAPVYELGPGRREMASAFGGDKYTAIEVGDPLPADLSGFVFANEFFDALPVRAGTLLNGTLRELMVTDCGLAPGEEFDQTAREYINRYWPHMTEGGRCELGFEALEWIDWLGARMEHGHVLIVDYGYTTRETIRFPQGTLMSYREHVASEDVLSNPGERDITAHVAIDALLDRAVLRGFHLVRSETLGHLVLRAVELNQSLAAGFEARKQLKTLLFGMGDSFSCLLLCKKPKKSPDCSGLSVQ